MLSKSSFESINSRAFSFSFCCFLSNRCCLVSFHLTNILLALNDNAEKSVAVYSVFISIADFIIFIFFSQVYIQLEIALPETTPKLQIIKIPVIMNILRFNQSIEDTCFKFFFDNFTIFISLYVSLNC